MSSKVFGPDDTRPVSRMTLRHVPRNAAAAAAQDKTDERDQFVQEIARLEKQNEEVRREAHAAGFREGEAAGRTQAAREMQPVIDRLSKTIDELSHLKAALRKEAEADTVKLSLAIARRVLRRELSIDPEALRGLVVGALEQIAGPGTLPRQGSPLSRAASFRPACRIPPPGASSRCWPTGRVK